MLHGVDERAVTDNGTKNNEICGGPNATVIPVHRMLVRDQREWQNGKPGGELLNGAADDGMRLCRLAFL